MNENDDSITRRIVVGLGNPGRKYARTRHNVGFRVLQTLVDQWALGDGREGFEGLTWNTRRNRGGDVRRVMMLAPMTYMNCSGRSVQGMLKYYKVRLDETLVVLDDLALPLGQLRIRSDGSAGGHNGLEDVLQACGTNEVPRLRIGIGAPPGGFDAKDYVLSKFRPDEQEEIDVAIRIAADAVENWIFGDIKQVMEKYNRKIEG